MSNVFNPLGQPLGMPVTDWQGATRPIPEVRAGRFCCLEPLNPSVHAEDLFASPVAQCWLTQCFALSRSIHQPLQRLGYSDPLSGVADFVQFLEWGLTTPAVHLLDVMSTHAEEFA